MSGFPPKHPKNGSRHHGTLTAIQNQRADFWPGDTFTCDMTGVTWRFNSDDTWTAIQERATAKVA